MSAQLMTPPEQTASGSVQAPSHVVMVRPHRFSVNASTAGDNAFQQPGVPDGARAARGAYDDTTRLAEALRDEGVAVSLYEDTSAETPDSVFPNNWFTTHPDGRILLCPMYAPNRRRERRHDVIEQLQQNCGATEVLDWTAAEDYGQFLEGTGAVVIDHEQQVAYGCRSQRLTAGLFTRFCREFWTYPGPFRRPRLLGASRVPHQCDDERGGDGRSGRKQPDPGSGGARERPGTAASLRAARRGAD